MSILTGKIAYPLDEPKDAGYGLNYRIKVRPDSGGELITFYVKTTHPDAAKLGKDVTVFYKIMDGKPRFEGVQGGASEAIAQVAHKPVGVDFDTIVRTWKACYAVVKEEVPVLRDEPAFMSAVNSIFIQASKEGAWVKETTEP